MRIGFRKTFCDDEIPLAPCCLARQNEAREKASIAGAQRQEQQFWKGVALYFILIRFRCEGADVCHPRLRQRVNSCGCGSWRLCKAARLPLHPAHERHCAVNAGETGDGGGLRNLACVQNDESLARGHRRRVSLAMRYVSSRALPARRASASSESSASIADCGAASVGAARAMCMRCSWGASLSGEGCAMVSAPLLQIRRVRSFPAGLCRRAA